MVPSKEFELKTPSTVMLEKYRAYAAIDNKKIVARYFFISIEKNASLRGEHQNHLAENKWNE